MHSKCVDSFINTHFCLPVVIAQRMPNRRKRKNSVAQRHAPVKYENTEDWRETIRERNGACCSGSFSPPFLSSPSVSFLFIHRSLFLLLSALVAGIVLLVYLHLRNEERRCACERLWRIEARAGQQIRGAEAAATEAASWREPESRRCSC